MEEMVDGGGGEQKEPTYVVHGAYCACSQGTRPARLIVPASHGDYIHDQPQLNVEDRVPMTNIRPFGLCQSTQNPDVQAVIDALPPMPKQEEAGWFASLFIKKEAPPPEEVPAPVCVAMCVPNVTMPWQSGKENVTIGGKDALLSTCTNTCVYGGVITIIHDGQRE
ncbi:DUF4280 domain-containing protein [Paenibacillus apiarius]|uniref:DUF4280 domain-containing protein n=1 Tax=Paenibacillus apiarius TaxID=46240 RepID=A0ABT4DV56_9BACL|nr:DUF4280 domain-containing protein [Paenibacillus apiarius]MCY9513497.1 DUF4280 domain-containing protein [Paenibacillus apiarius]MCY9521224.1 DUF4280 domain-containing protein [Paenibacillus apiarius]MCY9553413.1 DUF4280 domain-containing protein [Paenibacillus apiarius]MCY9559553.1 DUF4280 domain-containing protein [Paenibacillus apiarius]MCY9685442.1 DUF4280 domain-containing protein [Paenibacillus apiarius]